MTKPIPITDGGPLELWCELAPQGAFTRKRPDGTEYTQLLDTQAFNSLVQAFNASGRDVLLDFDHRSELTDDTRAAGWIKQVCNKGDVLEALIAFTDSGAAAVRGRDLRYLSPGWTLGPDNRPIALGSVALTNKPYFKHLRPVLNKDGGAVNPQPTQGTAVKELALLFGLAETASEADILAAVKKYKEDMDGKAVKAEGEQVAVANSAKIADRDAFVKAYCLNKDVALATLNAAKAPAAVVNKADARPPSFTAPGSGQALNRADFNKALAALPAGQRQAYFDNNIKNVAD
jgi:phage I-like protein